jgi:hypothetical protein
LGKYRDFFLNIQKMTVFFAFFRAIFGKSGQNALSLQQLILFILYDAYHFEAFLPVFGCLPAIAEHCFCGQ